MSFGTNQHPPEIRPREDQLEALFERVERELADRQHIVRELEELRAVLAMRQLDEEDARRRVERASECLASFTQALGHDVRAPFISIDSMMQLLDLDAPRLSRPSCARASRSRRARRAARARTDSAWWESSSN